MNLQAYEEKRVETKYGPRILKKYHADQSFWGEWRADKDGLKAKGFSVSKNRDGEWEVCQWLDLPKEEKERIAAEIEASKALDAEIDIPAPEGMQYKPFQKAGIAYALQRDNCLIADEMGLGKTIQVAGTINADPEIKKVIIIPPASIRLNWRNELEKWLVRPLKIAVVEGGKPENYPKDFDVLIINFDVVAKHRDRIDQTEWDLMVVDEVHYLKSQKAKRTKAVFGG